MQGDVGGARVVVDHVGPRHVERPLPSCTEPGLQLRRAVAGMTRNPTPVPEKRLEEVRARRNSAPHSSRADPAIPPDLPTAQEATRLHEVQTGAAGKAAEDAAGAGHPVAIGATEPPTTSRSQRCANDRWVRSCQTCEMV